ncbi:MAG: GNAT family N-acetyltransferase [Hyphomonadaceae bacterium]
MSALPDGYAIRAAQTVDIPQFALIESAADKLFEPTGLMENATEQDSIPALVFEDAIPQGLVSVVELGGNEIIGFSLCSVRKPDLYLDQVAVYPDHCRKGLGTALINTVMKDARARKLKTVSLSTFRNVPWNAPYYARLGFKEIPRKNLTKWMLELEALQMEYMDIGKRCFMRKRARR